jgi:hypothetical protein
MEKLDADGVRKVVKSIAGGKRANPSSARRAVKK